MISTLLVLHLLSAHADSPVALRAEALGKAALARGHEPRGAAPLIHLRELMDELDDLNQIADPLASLIYRRATDANVRTVARVFLADVERARGRTVKAQELLEGLGFVEDWQVVGSFDNEGKGGCDTDFGPEAAIDLRSTYPSRTREVGWHKLSSRTGDGYVDLSVMLRPNTGAVAYAFTVLQADQETKAVLSLGTSGAFRLFVNGSKVSASDRYNLPRIDQQRVQVNLRKGNNRVLLKVCQESGPLGFYARAEKPDGAKGSFHVVVPDAAPSLEKGVAPQPQPQPTLTEALAKQVQATPADAELRADYATVLAFARTYDEKERVPMLEAERAAMAKPADVELQLCAARLQLDDANHRRQFLDAALKADPAHPFARLELAQHELGREHYDVALRLADALLKDFPAFAPAYGVKARALDSLGQRVTAALVTEEAFHKLPYVPTVARDAFAASRRLDRIGEALDRARMALSLRFDDLNTRRALAMMLADQGHIDEATDQYRKILQLDPFDSQTLLRLAELLSANGKASDARAAFDLVREKAPEDPDVHEREGRALLHGGARDAALAAFTRSLQLRPQNPALKEMVRTLRGDDSGTSPFAMAVPPLLAELKDGSADDAVYLADVTSIRVQSSGLSSRFSQMVVKVMSQRGVEAFRSLPITYSPDRQEVRVLRSRIIKPDGSIVDSFSDQDRNINEPWTGMYYDARARVLTFPALAPGDVLELQWRLDDTAVDNLLSNYWGDVDAVQAMFPKKHYLYVVDMPKERTLYWNRSTLPAFISTEAKGEGDRMQYFFRATDVSRIVPEPQMPGWAEVASPLHVSTYKTWEDVGHYYWGLVRDQLTPNDELRKTVETALKGVDKKDNAKVVAAIYGFVVTNTRYVALEFGIHGYKPYRVDRILARRFGDCKDKASLIVAMLKVAGVDARLVLLRMRHLGALSGEPASLAAFNHAIAYVPSLDLYLDGTAEFHGSRELASADRVANVLVIEPDGPSRFLTTPEGPPDDNLTTLTMEVALKPDGSALVKGALVSTGQSAPDVRRAYQTPATRLATFEQQWASSFPGLTASEVTLSDPKNLEQPVTLTFKLATPRYAEAGAGSLRFFPLGASRGYTQAFAPLAERKFDVVLPGVWTNRFSVTYLLPPTWTPNDVPQESLEESPFGSVRLTAKKVDAGKVLVEGEMTLSRARITAKEYPAFRAWLLKVDQFYAKKLVVQQGGPQTARRR